MLGWQAWDPRLVAPVKAGTQAWSLLCGAGCGALGDAGQQQARQQESGGMGEEGGVQSHQEASNAAGRLMSWQGVEQEMRRWPRAGGEWVCGGGGSEEAMFRSWWLGHVGCGPTCGGWGIWGGGPTLVGNRC